MAAKKRTTKVARKPAKKAKSAKAVKTTVRKTAKKPAARKTVKKVTVKRKTTTSSAKMEIYRLAQAAPREKYFVLANGRPVKHVAELAEILHDIEDHVFSHHVNPERNDFANWVKDVFKDLELAKKMLGITRKEHLQLVIYKHAAEKAFAHKP